MKKTLILFLTLYTTLFALTEYEESYQLYSAKKYKEAFKAFQTLANAKDYDAAYLLGYMYENGEGCQKDIKQANKWYRYASKGYYEEKEIANHYTDKEKVNLYENLDKADDSVTNTTIKRFAESLYNLKAHKTNYFLPISYRLKDTYDNTNGHNAQSLETEFQLSFKYDYGANVLGLGEIYSAAYTQKSFWQLYEKSAYFRETNYNPELFVTIPIKIKKYLSSFKIMRISLAHQSNGRGGEEERSWNYISISNYFQYKMLFTEFNFFKRLPDTTDYNPQLIDYLGYAKIRFLLPYKKHLFKLSYRGDFSQHYGVEFNYSHPTRKRDDLYFYFKVFSGYAESLISYDERITKIGLGLSISR